VFFFLLIPLIALIVRYFTAGATPRGAQALILTLERLNNIAPNG